MNKLIKPRGTLGRAGVLNRTTNEQCLMGPRPSDGWIKTGVGGITDQT